MPLASTFKDDAKPGRMAFLQKRCTLSHKGPYCTQKLCRCMQREKRTNFFSSSIASDACSLWIWWITGISPFLHFKNCETAQKLSERRVVLASHLCQLERCRGENIGDALWRSITRAAFKCLGFMVKYN